MPNDCALSQIAESASLHEATPLAYQLLDEKGVLLAVNPAWSQAMGLDRDKARGRPFLDLIEQRHRDRWRQVFDRVSQGELVSEAFIKMRPRNAGHGLEVLLSASASMDQQGRPKYIHCVFCKTSKSGPHGKDLAYSKEIFEKAFRHSPIWVVINTLDQGRYIDVNETFLKSVGLTRDEVIGKSSTEVGTWITARDREKMLEKVQEEGSVRDYEVKRRIKGGELRDMLFSCEPIQIDGEKCLVSVSLDITDIRRAEKEKLALQKQLQHAQRMEALGTLAGGLAHDFNNILTAIIGYAEVGIHRSRNGKNCHAQLERVLSAGQRAGHLVSQVLAFSRRMEPERKPLNLNWVVLQARELLESALPKNVAIEMDLDDDIFGVMGEHYQFEQILMNLAGNAKDAMPGGGRLTIATSNAALSKEDCLPHPNLKPGRYVRMTISDTGTGIDPETLNRIFDPFFTTKDIGKGTGLGLSAVFGIVTAHGGHIRCDSEPGRGTVFEILLPALDNKVEPGQDSLTDLENVPGGSETILLVDDERTILEVGKWVLEHYGYTVITADCGESGIESYAANPSGVDAVVLDLGMPGMGGHACLKGLMAINPDVKVIIASGYAARGPVRDALNEGAKSFLKKPFQMAEMAVTLRKTLDQD